MLADSSLAASLSCDGLKVPSGLASIIISTVYSE